MMNRLLVVGAGGHGCVVAETALRTESWSDVAHLDDLLERPQHQTGVEILGSINDLERLTRSSDQFVIAVGDNSARLRLFEDLRRGLVPASVVAPEALVSKTVAIGNGTVIMAGAIVNVGVVVGEACILNTASTIEHGVTLGPGVHVGPGAILGGDVDVGARTFIGMGARVLPGVSLGDDVVVGAGAVVVHDLPEAGVYLGVPARPASVQRPCP